MGSSSGLITIVLMILLVCNCAAACSILSIVCGLFCLLVRVCPSYCQLSWSFLLSPSQQFQSVKNRLAVSCSDSTINFLTSVSDPVFFCLFHFSSDYLIDCSCALPQVLFLRLLLLSHRFRISFVIQGFFFFLALPSTAGAVSTSAPWTFSVRLSMFSSNGLSAANLPPIVSSNWSGLLLPGLSACQG